MHLTVRLILQLVAFCALSACVSPTPPIATGPLSPAETEVYKLVLNVATDVAIARTIADDCPNLRFNEAAEDLEIAAIVGRANVLLGGDERRQNSVIGRLLIAA